MRQQLCTFSKCLQIYPGKIRTFCSIEEKKDVNRDRLIGKDKVKYYIMDIAFPILDKASSWKEYISRLKSEGVDITMVRDEYGNVRGIVYTAENLSFAGKKVDPELSFGNLRRKFSSYGQEKPLYRISENMTPFYRI